MPLDSSLLTLIMSGVLVLMITLLAANLVLKKTKSMRLALYPTLISPLGTLIIVGLIPIINTDPSAWVGLGQWIIAIFGTLTSVVIFAITVGMLAILKKKL
jgi:hypothetical protein